MKRNITVLAHCCVNCHRGSESTDRYLGNVAQERGGVEDVVVVVVVVVGRRGVLLLPKGSLRMI